MAHDDDDGDDDGGRGGNPDHNYRYSNDDVRRGFANDFDAYRDSNDLDDQGGSAADYDDGDSDDEGDGARFNARDAGRTPGPTKPKWSKERGREVVATRGGKEEQDPRWADDGLISGIPGGASPFGGKSKPPAGVTSRK